MIHLAEQTSDFIIYPMGDTAVVVEFGQKIDTHTHHRVRALAQYLDKYPLPGMVEYIPAYTTVTVIFDLLELQAQTSGETIFSATKELITEAIGKLGKETSPAARTVVIPVCYGGDCGPDLAYVAGYHGITPEEVIMRHSAGDYIVYMLGFAPGFSYLGGLPEELATPRRPTPRLAIPAGSVGIAGKQTGVYPIESPAGWQIIGRTPRHLFQPQANPPALLRAGDIVRFRPITDAEYVSWEEERA